ncbi:MAG: hypothetical protein ACRDV1_09270 [Actinomycetes bacterium]
MFIQVIQGSITDRSELRAMIERWDEQLAPHAIGWLGTTAGLTANDDFVALARFGSEDAARANSERPEQHQWWMETSKLFSGDVIFHDCREVDLMRGGGSDDAGFVQIIQGRARDVARLREMNTQFERFAGDYRPDLLGSAVALHGDGGFTQAAYFTTEAEARAGESAEAPAELKPILEEEMSLLEDLRFFDLQEHWLSSPR